MECGNIEILDSVAHIFENRIRIHTIQADNRKYLAGSLASGYGQIETGFGPINTRPGNRLFPGTFIRSMPAKR